MKVRYIFFLVTISITGLYAMKRKGTMSPGSPMSPSEKRLRDCYDAEIKRKLESA